MTAEGIRGFAHFHDVRNVAAETLIAVEVFERAGSLFRQVLDAVTMEALALEGGGHDEDRLVRYDPETDDLHFDEGELRQLLNIGVSPNRVPGELPPCAFDVLEMSLSSPLQVRARLAAVILVLNTTSAPVPAATTASMLSQLAQAATVLVAATEASDLGYRIYVEHKTEAEIARDQRETAEYMQALLAQDDTSPIQRNLQLLGYYDGQIDNIFGEMSQEAVRIFALDHKLDPGIAYSDPEFIASLAEAVVRYGHSVQE